MAPRIQTVHTLQGPINTPPSEQSVKSRYCPGMTNPFRFDPAIFNPLNRPRDEAIRRSCMLMALFCHAVPSVLEICRAMIGAKIDVLGLLVDILVFLIGTLFFIGCLTAIGQAEGEKLVLGRRVGRWHFDVFLMICAAVYGISFLSYLFGIGGSAGMLLGLASLPMWVLIFAVAWIATWESIPTSSV